MIDQQTNRPTPAINTSMQKAISVIINARMPGSTYLVDANSAGAIHKDRSLRGLINEMETSI